METGTSGHGGCETEIDLNVAIDRLPLTQVSPNSPEIRELCL